MHIEHGKVVSLAYRLQLADGSVVDEATTDEPLYYLHGFGGLLPRFESELEGRQAGESLAFELSAEDGYGVRMDGMTQEIARSFLPPDPLPEVGMHILADFGTGPRPYPITRVTEASIWIDTNHPLAGQSLHFSVEVIEVRPATEDELAHGHVHGPGGVHHH
jgi:FKBP-type peptidyl-prolyl cis-trans isomerase SlyD